MDIELLDYDMVPQNHATVSFRTRPAFVGDATLPVPKDKSGAPTVAVDENGLATRMVSPAGDVVKLTRSRADVDPAAWAAFEQAYEDFEAAALTFAETVYADVKSSPQALDAKIAEAETARAELADKTAQIADLDAQITAKWAQLEAVDAVKET